MIWYLKVEIIKIVLFQLQCSILKYSVLLSQLFICCGNVVGQTKMKIFTVNSKILASKNFNCKF